MDLAVDVYVRQFFHDPRTDKELFELGQQAFWASQERHANHLSSDLWCQWPLREIPVFNFFEKLSQNFVPWQQERKKIAAHTP